MSPQPTIAHYRITSKLGEGGMGAVYRATDTKLHREVAIKVLPDTFAQDSDRMARFEREAQVLASLNHPNIAAIYGVEERALVMELVPGPTLAERIARGAMSLEEALPIARQIADALEYAHERGVIHRDLKPANIKITPEGQVKVLDFGLAKAISGDAAAAADPMSSPTLTMRATMLGAIMGTAAYMSPEQARGQNVDRRADIWAFGVVLYEMLTGRVLFAGPTISDTLAAVLKTEIDVSALPAQARPALERCLRRELRERWHSISDVILTLEAAMTAVQPGATRQRTSRWMSAAAVAIAIAIVALAGWWRAAQPAPQPLTRLSVDLGPQAVTGLNITVAISPDGRRLVYPARGPDGKQQLATRLLDQEQPTLLPGTENGFDPFFSPDGQSIGFFAGAQIKKISVHGGVPVALCPATFSRGASWSEDGNIVAGVGQLTPLIRVPSAGGTPQALTKLRAGASSHRWPQVLPGGKAVLYTAMHSVADAQGGDIEAVTLRTGEAKVLQRGGYHGRYLSSGHLVYVSHGVLFGVGFDPERLEVRGEPTPLLQGFAANPATGGAQFGFSQTGTLVYLAGKEAAQSWQLTWLDSSGKTKPLNATPGSYVQLRFSPDGRRLAFTNGGDIYIQDFERDATVRLTSTGQAALPVWTPDGKHIVFQSGVGGFGISWIRSDGAAAPQWLLESPNNILPHSFSPDGRRLVYSERPPETGAQLWMLPLDTSDPNHPKAGKPELFLGLGFVPRLSPDGRWIAYRSPESGSNEIYVRPFPSGAGGKWQVSTGGGLYVFWSNNERELFYETTDNRIMVVDYTVQGDSFAPGKPRLWSDKQIFYPGSNLDLSPDGKRFAVLTAPESASGEKGSVHVTMLFNFFDELRRRIPVGGK